MIAASIDTTNRRNFKLTFGSPVKTSDVIKYVADIYRKASGDNTIKVQRPADVVRDNDGRYAIVDGSRRCGLFEIGGLTEEPAQLDHYVSQYHATEQERDLLIIELERICSQFKS